LCLTSNKLEMNKIYPLFLIVSNLFLVSYGITDTTKVALKPFLNIKTQDTINIDDGPYILIQNDSLIEKNIVKGTVESKVIPPEVIQINFLLEVSNYNNVVKIAALSDIHGQFDLTTTILINNGIIDKNLDWAFGKGHLVILGDVFDRGAEVTELLWLIRKLEQQALEAGGIVHFVLGNHEFMTMQNDLRYINKKYRRTEQLLNTSYPDLYGINTVMGRWLRSKPTALKINDIFFVHGGISKEFIQDGFDLAETNEIMRQSLYEEDWLHNTDSIYNKFHDNFGPIWYRGYFKPEFKKSDLNKILRTLKVKHIVVGHTPHRTIQSLFDKKLLAIDSSIQFGGYGEVLLIENGKYFRGTRDGQKIEIK